jgi:signal transduction histidine kinase
VVRAARFGEVRSRANAGRGSCDHLARTLAHDVRPHDRIRRGPGRDCQCERAAAAGSLGEIELAVDRLDLTNDVCGALFGITQEAVANAGRHANASRVVVTLRTVGDEIELRVSDDGEGFHGPGPLSPMTSGHIGLASMRERAELIGGRLDIETGERGTKVLVRAPFDGVPARV